MEEEIRKKVNELVTGVGAMCEFLGLMRKNLMEQGFTREEAVAMCSMALTAMLAGGRKDDKEV